MSHSVLINGELIPADLAVVPITDRSFMYGDGFFESMRIVDGKPLFVEDHLKRMVRAADQFSLQLPKALTQKGLEDVVRSLAQENGWDQARVRLHVSRSGEAGYGSSSSDCNWVMNMTPLSEREFALNKKGLRVGIWREAPINPAPLSSFKSANALPYILAASWAGSNALDDALLLDAAGTVSEASASNLFLVKGDELITSHLRSGGVLGVMRAVVIGLAEREGLCVQQREVRVEDFSDADECWLTNAVRGIRWVGAFEKKRYFHRRAERMVRHLNRAAGLS